MSSIIYFLCRNNKEFNIIEFFTKKFLLYGFILLIVTQWKDFVNTFILDSFTKAAVISGNGGAYVAQELSDPAKIIQKGISLVVPVFNYMTSFTGLRLIANLHNIIIAMILAFAIFACFAYIGIQFLLVYLEFYIIALLALITVPFGVIKQLKFLGERSIGSVIAVAIRLMVLTFIVALIINMVHAFKTAAYDPVIYLRVLLASIGMAFLTSRVPKTVTNLLAGSPRI